MKVDWPWHKLRNHVRQNVLYVGLTTFKMFLQVFCCTDKRSCLTQGPVKWMGDCGQVNKPFRYANSYLGQLSLAISLSAGAMSTSQSWK